MATVEIEVPRAWKGRDKFGFPRSFRAQNWIVHRVSRWVEDGLYPFVSYCIVHFAQRGMR